MSLHATWAACAQSIARCLSAGTPDLAEFMFSAERERPGDGWFRLGPEEAGGFGAGGPGELHFQLSIPAGIDPASIPVMAASGRLRTEAEAFLRDAHVLARGNAIRINGGLIPIAPTEAAVASACGIVETLEAALALLDPAAVAAGLRDHSIAFLRRLGRDGAPHALAATRADVVARRAGCGVGGPLWLLAQLQQLAGVVLEPEGLVPDVLYRVFDPFGPGADPGQACRRAVADLLEAGLDELLAGLVDTLLADAEPGVVRALEARGVMGHGTALFDAVGDAWAAMRLVELLHPGRNGAGWATAGDIVLRGTHALVIDAINLGSGAALLRHQASIAAAGKAEADELIERRWFYPRALRDTLVGSAPA